MKYDLEESTSTLVKLSAQLFTRLAGQILRKKKIAHAYTPFLMHLWDKDGQTQAVLHRKIGIEQPTAVRTLDRMERDRFIRRVRSETDRREIRIFLTPKAESLQQHVLDCAQNINLIALKDFSKEDIKHLNKNLRKLISNLEEAMN